VDRLRLVFSYVRCVRGPLLASVFIAIVLALPPQVTEVYRSIAQSGVFADANQRLRELIFAAGALVVLSIIVWCAARASTPCQLRQIRSEQGTLSLAPLCNIALALLPVLAAAAGCLSARTLPLTPAARQAASLTLANIVLAGGGHPTPQTVNSVLAPLLDYNRYLSAGAWGLFGMAGVILAILLFIEYQLARHRRYLLPASTGLVIAVALLIISLWLATERGALLTFLTFSMVATIALSTLCYLSDRLGIPLGGLLLVYVVVISYWELNDNHRAFTLKSIAVTRGPGLPQLGDEFQEWLGSRSDRAFFGESRYPVYVVAVQGGGIYAAYHAASVLGAIQDSCPAFVEHVFAISGVSGGSVGAGVFETVVRASWPDGHRPSTGQCIAKDKLPRREAAGEFSAVRVAEKILEGDFLAPVVYGLVGPDLLQLFLLAPVVVNDRARYFELALEERAQTIIQEEITAKRMPVSAPNLLAQPFTEHWSPTADLPALALNTTDVGTGRRRIIAPFSFPSDDAVFLPLSSDELRGMPLSTAAFLSARFPWITPPGWYRTKEAADQPEQKNYLVDGGYFDNSGVATALDIVRAIKDLSDVRDKIQVRLLILSRPNDRTNETFFGIEFLAPIRALLRVRATGGQRAVGQAERELGVEIINGHSAVQRADLVDFGYPPPLGWRLSNVSSFLIEAQNGLGNECSSPAAASDLRGNAACMIDAIRRDLRSVSREDGSVR